MSLYRRSVLTICAIAALVALAVPSAAQAITAAPAGAITAASLGKLTFSASGGLTNPAIQCDVQLGGSLNSSIANAAGGALGSLASASFTNCTTGTAVALLPSGWNLTLTGPANLVSLTVPAEIVGFSLSQTIAGTTCLYGSTLPLSLSISGSGSGPYRLGLATVATNIIPWRSGSVLCPTTLRANGIFGLSPAQTLTI